MNNDLFNSYIPLVYKIVNKMNYGYIDKDDLIQAGLIGLYKATLKYNKDINDNFISFSSMYIISEIKNELRSNKLIKLNKRIIKIKKYLKENEKLSFNQISKNLQEPNELVYLAFIYKNDIHNIDEEINEIKDINSKNYSSNDILSQILMLKEEYKQVLILKYYKNYSQQEISNILRCSQSKVSRIEKQALNIIKNKML